MRGELPEGWELLSLSNADVCIINPIKKEILNLPNNTIVSFIPMSAVSDKGYIIGKENRELGEVIKGYTYFQNDDILFAKITPCMENGKCVIADNLMNHIGFGSTEFHVFRPRKKCISKWIFYFLRQEKIRIAAKTHFTGTAGQQRVPTSFFEKIEIPLPPLETQKQIVAILEKAEQIQRLQVEVDKHFDELIKSIFIDMFGDPVRNPKGWEKVNLEELLISGPINGIYKSKEYMGKGEFLLDNICVYKGMKVHLENLRKIIASPNEISKYKVNNGDILFNRVSVKAEGVGKAVWVEEINDNYLIESNLLKVSINKNRIHHKYLVYYLNTDYLRRVIIKKSVIANQASINQKAIKSIPILLPSYRIQMKFIDILTLLESNHSLNQNKSILNTNFFNSLIQKAFKGELVK